MGSCILPVRTSLAQRPENISVAAICQPCGWAIGHRARYLSCLSYWLLYAKAPFLLLAHSISLRLLLGQQSLRAALAGGAC